MQGNDVAREEKIDLHVFVKGGGHGRTSHLQVRRPTKGLTSLTPPCHIAHAIRKTLMSPFRIGLCALQLAGRYSAPIHMKFFLRNLLRIRGFFGELRT